MSVVVWLGGIYTVIHKLVEPAVAAGYTSLIAVMLFCCGMIMIMLGLLGEYVGRIFMNLNHLPQYVVRDRLNVPRNKRLLENQSGEENEYVRKYQ